MFFSLLRFVIPTASLLAWVLGCTNPCFSQASDPPHPLAPRIDETLGNARKSLIDLRHDLHRHPELSDHEVRTSRIVAERLEKLGLEVRTEVGGYGVVGVLKLGQPGPVVAFRADMDATPSHGPDPVPFASVNPGVRHGCGHDVHTTIGVGIAETMASIRNELPGTLVLIFQPSEENGRGAAAMIEEGALRNPAPREIYAFHCAPLPVGKFATGEGVLLAGMDLVLITLSGTGNLEQTAERCADWIASVNELESAANRADNSGFTQAGVFRSEPHPTDGTWMVQGMVRASSPERHARARRHIERGLGSIDSDDVRVSFDYQDQRVPPLNNHASLVPRSCKTLRSIFGRESVLVIDSPSPDFSEDFSHFQKRIPGIMIFLGVSNPEKGILGIPHHPNFAADDDAIAVGIRGMTRILIESLERVEK